MSWLPNPSVKDSSKPNTVDTNWYPDYPTQVSRFPAYLILLTWTGALITQPKCQAYSIPNTADTNWCRDYQSQVSRFLAYLILLTWTGALITKPKYQVYSIPNTADTNWCTDYPLTYYCCQALQTSNHGWGLASQSVCYKCTVIKSSSHDIAEKLMKLMLNTNNSTQYNFLTHLPGYICVWMPTNQLLCHFHHTPPQEQEECL